LIRRRDQALTLWLGLLLLTSSIWCGCGADEPPSPEADTWRAFTDSLARAGEVLDRSATPHDDIVRAEGLRYLARLVGEGVRSTLESADPSRPHLGVKLFSGGDTSDARYLDAMIDGARTYRISGTRGTAPLMEMTVYDGKFGLHEQSARIGYITEETLMVGEAGRIEVVLSPVPQPGNWIQTTPEARYLMIRQYAHDWSVTIGAQLAMELQDPAESPGPLDAATVRRELLEAAAFVERLALHWAETVDRIRMLPANTLVAVPTWLPYSMPAGHRFASGEFLLEPDEVLVIEFDPPDAPYWGFQLVNYWFEPIDYGGVGSHVNDRSARFEADGSLRLIVGEADPDACNWLATRGHRVGTMQFRLSRAGDLAVPGFETRVMKTAELSPSTGCLPIHAAMGGPPGHS